jgi:hypothetical protein
MPTPCPHVQLRSRPVTPHAFFVGADEHALEAIAKTHSTQTCAALARIDPERLTTA